MTRLSPALLAQIEATLQTPLADEQAPLLLVCQEVRACWKELAELRRVPVEDPALADSALSAEADAKKTRSGINAF